MRALRRHDPRRARRPRERRWWWTHLAPLLLWIAMILFVASRPLTFFFAPETTVVAGVPRRFVQYPYHVGVFLVLAILFLRCLRSPASRWRPERAAALALMGSLAVSVCAELVQLSSPTRSPAIADMAADLSGALAGLTLMRLWLRTQPSRRRLWTW